MKTLIPDDEIKRLINIIGGENNIKGIKLKLWSLYISFNDSQKVDIEGVNASGKYYSTPQKIVSDYQFKQPIPVNIYYITTKKGLNVAKVAGNILLTPFTLAFDAAGGIFLLPIYFNMENWN